MATQQTATQQTATQQTATQQTATQRVTFGAALTANRFLQELKGEDLSALHQVKVSRAEDVIQPMAVPASEAIRSARRRAASDEDELTEEEAQDQIEEVLAETIELAVPALPEDILAGVSGDIFERLVPDEIEDEAEAVTASIIKLVTRLFFK